MNGGETTHRGVVKIVPEKQGENTGLAGLKKSCGKCAASSSI